MQRQLLDSLPLAFSNRDPGDPSTVQPEFNLS